MSRLPGPRHSRCAPRSTANLKSRARLGTSSLTAPTASPAAVAAPPAEHRQSPRSFPTFLKPAPPAEPSRLRRIRRSAFPPLPASRSSVPVLETLFHPASRAISSATASSYHSPTSHPAALRSVPPLTSGGRSPSALGKSLLTPTARRSRIRPAR